MSEYRENERVVIEHNGRRFAGTVDEDGYAVSDINGYSYLSSDIARKLEGLERAKVGDIVVDDDGNE